MNCPTCGNPLPENAKFCNKCGRSIRKETPETPAFPPAPEEKNPVIPTAFHAAEEKEPASSTTFHAPEANLFSSGRAPQSPASEKPAGERPPRPRFDVRTGKPILYDNEGNRVTEPPRPVQSPRPRFDPRTGRPVLNEVPKPAAPVPPRPHYDVQTGEPIVYDAAGNRVSPAPRTTPRPATPAAPQPPMPEPPRRVKAVRPSGGLKAVCIILCVLAALSGLLASVTGVVRTGFRADTVRALVEEADLSGLRMTDSSGREVSLADYIEQTCRIDFLQEYGIDRNELNTLLDQPFLKRYVGKLLAGYAVSLADGEEPEPLTRNGLVDFLRSNDQQIKQLTGFSFVEYEYAGRLGEIDEYLEEYSLDGIFQSLGFSQAEPEKMALTAGVIQNLTGVDLPGLGRTMKIVFLVCAILAPILLILVWVLLRKHLRSAFLQSGVALTALGVLDLAAGGIGMLAVNGTGMGLANLLADPLLIRLMIIGGVILVLGGALVILRRLVKKRPA